MPTRDNLNSAGAAKRPRRRYESPLRQQQAARTREEIIAAGARIAHRLASWDWRSLTFKAVAQQAGVSVRTVHRHFCDERSLRGAILQRLVEESGVRLDHIELQDFAGIAAGVNLYLSSFAARPTAIEEPNFAALDRQRREALAAAVRRVACECLPRQCEMAAAVLDMLWSPSLNERLNDAWRLNPGESTAAIKWIAGLMEDAIRSGRLPRVDD